MAPSFGKKQEVKHFDTKLLTYEPVLLGAHSVGVLHHATEVEHGKHGEDHHHTLEQKGQLKLLPYPAMTKKNRVSLSMHY